MPGASLSAAARSGVRGKGMSLRKAPEMNGQDQKDMDDSVAASALSPAGRPVAFDAQEFLPMTAEWDMSEADKTELLKTLWSIMLAFVDLGLRIDDIDKLLPEFFAKNGADPADLLELPHSETINTTSEAP